MFRHGAVSVVPDCTLARKSGVRHRRITLVLGSSGSGKTMFALRHLPLLLFGDDDSENKNFFCVHFQAEEAHQRVKKNKILFSQAVDAIVEEMIYSKLCTVKMPNVKNLDLFLHVVIDEAGGEAYQNYFDHETKIQLLISSIVTNVRFVFQQGLHVTVAGTGLEATTTRILSTPDAMKFRMQRWMLINFSSLILESKHPHPTLVMETIEEFPILEDLIAIARCSYFLMRAMKDVHALRSNRIQEFVNVLIAKVVDRYIASNGLSRLKNATEKFILVRSVFKQLDASTRRPGHAFFPDFDDIQDKALHPVATSLLDINVESSKGGLTIVNENVYALTMSPALVIVLSYLLSAEARITWDWHGFESMVMLSELKRMIVLTSDVPSRLNRLVLELRTPMPGGNATKWFSAPMVGNCTIVLNGPLAGYADVIAPYRLVQAKFSADDSTSIDLYIQKELDEMGLTTSTIEQHVLKQRLTDVFYSHMWTTTEVPDALVKNKVFSTVRKYRHECYPFDILNGRRLIEEPAVVLGEFMENEGWFVTVNGERQALQPQSFVNKRLIHAVFVTNSSAFRLKTERQKQPIVTPDDVDSQGKLLPTSKNIADGLIDGLRRNVELRFMFFGRH